MRGHAGGKTGGEQTAPAADIVARVSGMACAYCQAGPIHSHDCSSEGERKESSFPFRGERKLTLHMQRDKERQTGQAGGGGKGREAYIKDVLGGPREIRRI